MTSKLYVIVAILMLLAIPDVNSQYFQFSQYNFSNQRVNPAIIGISKFMSASLLSRSQSTGGDFNINSNLVSFQRPFLNRSTGRAWSGIGLTLMDDRSGGVFKTEEVAVNYALNIRLTRFRSLSVGFKWLYQARSINLNGFYTGSQYVPDRGFDGSLPSGENNAELRNNLSTLSTGIYWQQVDRKDRINAYGGISLFDINKPNDAFLKKENQLSSTLILSGGFRAYQLSEFSIFPEFLYSVINSGQAINVGTKWQYKIKKMPNQPGAQVELLTKCVLGRSGIVGVQFHKANLSLGISYDFPLFVTNPSNLGAVEFGVEVRKLTLTKSKKRTTKKEIKKPVKNTVNRKVPTKNQPLKPLNKDSAKITPIQTVTTEDTVVTPIEITKYDTVANRLAAEVGRITQEPLIVEKITLHFQFEFNSVDLDDETEKFLDQLSETLGEDKELKVRIVGHTDNIGPEKFNQKLSLKRAESVRDFLLKNEINTERINADGKGMSSPLTKNDTEEGRRKNRRVEIILYYKR